MWDFDLDHQLARREDENAKFWHRLKRVTVDCNEWQGYDIRSNSLGEIELECTEA